MRNLLLLAASCTLCACAGGSNLTRAVKEQPVGFPADMPLVGASAYKIGPFDRVSVTVFKEPDLSFQNLPVDGDGTISLPLIGQVVATDKTANELRDTIAAQLGARYLRNPQVTVFVSKFSNLTITVDGQVNKAGVYEIPGTATLTQAVALGEGTTEFAKLKEVVVLRKQNNQTYIARFDLVDIYSGHTADPRLQQGDTVIVGFSSARRTVKDLLQVLPSVAGIFVALIQRN